MTHVGRERTAAPRGTETLPWPHGELGCAWGRSRLRYVATSTSPRAGRPGPSAIATAAAIAAAAIAAPSARFQRALYGRASGSDRLDVPDRVRPRRVHEVRGGIPCAHRRECRTCRAGSRRRAGGPAARAARLSRSLSAGRRESQVPTPNAAGRSSAVANPERGHGDRETGRRERAQRNEASNSTSAARSTSDAATLDNRGAEASHGLVMSQMLRRSAEPPPRSRSAPSMPSVRQRVRHDVDRRLHGQLRTSGGSL